MGVLVDSCCRCCVSSPPDDDADAVKMDVEYDDILLLLFLFCCDIGCWVDDVDVNVNASVQHHDMVITRVVVTDRRNGLVRREIIVEIDLQLNSVGEQHWSVNTVMKNKEFVVVMMC